MMAKVRALVEDLRRVKRRLEELQQQYAALTPGMRGNGQAQVALELEQAIEQNMTSLRKALQEIQEIGIEVKDIDTGLVDFPSQREGRIVYLCWKVDEPAIAYWHELDTGFAGRQPL